jgi:hypothetical protein
MRGSILDVLDILQYVEYAKYVAICHNIPNCILGIYKHTSGPARRAYFVAICHNIPNCILGIYKHTSGPARRAKHWLIRFFNLEAANPSSRKSRMGAQLEPGVVAKRQEVAGQ